MPKVTCIAGFIAVISTAWLNAQINVGTGNVISGTDSSIAGGRDNKIGSGADNAIIASGRYNTNTGTFGSIGGGQYNIAGPDYATVPGGRNAKARTYGQLAYASGAFSGPGFGEAQFGLYVLRGTTVGAVTEALALDGDQDTQHIAIPDNASFLLDIDVVCRSGTKVNNWYGNFFHWKIVVENQNGALSLDTLDAVSKTNHNANVTVSMSSSGNKFKLSGTGEASETVYWVATVRATELVKPE